MQPTFYQADVMAWAKQYEGEPFHALLCDPPYHLTSITERFGKEGSAPAQYGTDGAFQRASRGFMNQQWDGGDIAFRPEFWAAMKDLLYPGAFGFAFASTRGYHRMACAIEDSGFIINPMIAWSFGSGFPKATRIDTQIDKAAGVQGEVLEHYDSRSQYDGHTRNSTKKQLESDGYGSITHTQHIPRTAPATELAQAWHGHRYGLQAIKPSLEPICVFQKPYEGKPVDCMVRTGAGAINITKGRISSGDEYQETARVNDHSFGGASVFPSDKSKPGFTPDSNGRWPANLLLGHSAACTPDGCAADCAVEAMGRQSGVTKSGAHKGELDKPSTNEVYGKRNKANINPFPSNEGTADRFFQHTDWELDKADPFFYTAKASTAEREAGLEGFIPTTTDDGRNTPIDNPYLRGETTRRNSHPTVKPLSLTKYLAGLLLPPDMYAPRRLLVPFSGSGSECIGAMLAGWDEVHGIELSAEYCEIARARAAYWYERRAQAKHIKLQIAKPQPVQSAQVSMFDLFNEAA